MPPSIRWECVVCGDEGLVHGWEDSHADLRGTAETPGSELLTIAVSEEAADLLRTVLLLDAKVERLVFAGRTTVDGVVMEGDIEAFEELLDTVAAEANHEPSVRRRKNLDSLFSALADALSTPPPDDAPTPPAARTEPIRAATVHDLPAVLRLWRQAEAEPTHTDNLEALIGLLERDPSALLIAEDEGAIVGSVIAAWDGWRGSIYRLAVAPTYRRQGLARALLEAAEERLDSAGAVRLQATVAENSPAALGFWTASDWEQTQQARFVKG